MLQTYKIKGLPPGLDYHDYKPLQDDELTDSSFDNHLKFCSQPNLSTFKKYFIDNYDTYTPP